MWGRINCRACGNEIDATVTYCQFCGTSLRYQVKKESPSGSTILGVVLIVMTILTASLAAALIAEMSENARLNQDFADFDRTKRVLDDEIDALERNKRNLEDDIEDLEDDKDDLESMISSLKDDIRDLEDEDSEWWYIYRLRTGEYPYDLVTPDDPTIISKSSQVLGADADGELTWNDMFKINDWVHTNIDYSYDPYITNPHNYGEWDYWQTPEETLDRGEGDCDDQANLALSLMLAEENVGWLWGAITVFGGASGHVGIFVNVVDDQMSVLDPTGGWRSPTSQSEPLALDEWASRGGYGSVTRVLELYSDTGSEKFDTLQEFYDWF